MQEIPFAISLSGSIIIAAGKATITIRKAQTVVDLKLTAKSDSRLILPKGQTLFDVILNTARDYVISLGTQTTFTAAELFYEAIERYPNLKRTSWTAHFMASAPAHPSHRHFSTRKDFFEYLGKGTYKLQPRYFPTELEEEE